MAVEYAPIPASAMGIGPGGPAAPAVDFGPRMTGPAAIGRAVEIRTPGIVKTPALLTSNWLKNPESLIPKTGDNHTVVTPSIFRNPGEFRDEQSNSRERTPAYFIPHRSERPPINFSLTETAAHELGHAIKAFQEHIPVKYLTVERSGPILGVTSLAGLVTDRTKIARVMAAGGVDHPGIGRASGYGSDAQKVEMLGMSFSDLKNSVSNEIHSEYSPEIIARAAELVAFLNEHTSHKYLSEGMIKTVLSIAEYEIEAEAANPNTKYSAWQIDWDAMETPSPLEEETRLILDDQNNLTITWIMGKNEWSEVRCAICGLKHNPQEHFQKNKEIISGGNDKQEYPQAFQPVKPDSDFSVSGTGPSTGEVIFTGIQPSEENSSADKSGGKEYAETEPGLRDRKVIFSPYDPDWTASF